MILIIIFVALLVLGIIGIIVGFIMENHWIDGDIAMKLVGVISSCSGAVLLLAFGLIAIVTNSRVEQQKVLATYTERAIELNTTYQSLLNNYEPIAVYQYNKAVGEYKTEILVQQKQLSNPWINWFTCCAYNDLDVDAVCYYEYH